MQRVLGAWQERWHASWSLVKLLTGAEETRGWCLLSLFMSQCNPFVCRSVHTSHALLISPKHMTEFLGLPQEGNIILFTDPTRMPERMQGRFLGSSAQCAPCESPELRQMSLRRIAWKELGTCCHLPGRLGEESKARNSQNVHVSI